MQTRHKGNISEAFVIGRLLEIGYTVLVPVGNMERYDLMLEDADGDIVRAQVKTGRLRNGAIVFSTASVNYKGERKSYDGQVDVFLIYSPDTREVYCVPCYMASKASMYLRVTQSKYKTSPKSTIKWAEDYILRDRVTVTRHPHKVKNAGSIPAPATTTESIVTTSTLQ